MLPDRVSNPGPLTYESDALPIALCGPALLSLTVLTKSISVIFLPKKKCGAFAVQKLAFALQKSLTFFSAKKWQCFFAYITTENLMSPQLMMSLVLNNWAGAPDTVSI